MNESNISNNDFIKFRNMLEKTNLIILINILFGILIFNVVCILIYKIQKLCCLYKPPSIDYYNRNDEELIA